MSKKKSTKEKNKNWTPLKLYFLLMTLTGVIGSLISIGILIFSLAQNFIITDQEYVFSERYYELEQCSQPALRSAQQENDVNPTEAEIAKCEAEKTEKIIASRKANFKIDMLRGGIWTILFLIILFIHYPRFMRYYKE